MLTTQPHMVTSWLHMRAQAALWPQMEWNVRRVLGNDVSAISTLRCLKLFLERMGANYLDAHTSHTLAGAYLPLVRPAEWSEKFACACILCRSSCHAYHSVRPKRCFEHHPDINPSSESSGIFRNHVIAVSVPTEVPRTIRTSINPGFDFFGTILPAQTKQCCDRAC